MVYVVICTPNIFSLFSVASIMKTLNPTPTQHPWLEPFSDGRTSRPRLWVVVPVLVRNVGGNGGGIEKPSYGK
jgi:hypothetical protein